MTAEDVRHSSNAVGQSPVVLGKITAPWGIKGWVRIHPFGDDPGEWEKMDELWLERRPPESGWLAVRLLELKLHGDGVVALLDGVGNRDAAESVSGCLISAPRSALPLPREGEYYWGDLVGMRVLNRSGDEIGRVREMLETGANDVMVIDGVDGTEKLLPFVATVVQEVRSAEKEIVVDWERDW